jgi:hypothetical protein
VTLHDLHAASLSVRHRSSCLEQLRGHQRCVAVIAFAEVPLCRNSNC